MLFSPNSAAPVLISIRRKSPVLTGAFAALLSALLFCPPARGACTGPPSLQAKLKAHPDAQAWAALGNWFGEHNQFPCAAEAFRSAVRLSPKSPQLNYLLGLSLYESHRFAEAVPPLHDSIAADPHALKTHLLLASTLVHLNQTAQAEAEWRAALKLDASSAMAIHGLSQALLAEGDYTSEIRLLRSAKLDESLAVDLAVAYSRSNMQDDAISTITRALDTSPRSIELSNSLVTLYVKAQRTDEAERVAEKCYQAHPNDVSAQTSYLRTLVLNGDWKTATPLGKKLLAEAPREFETLYLNGVLERQSGDYAAARQHLSAAAALNPQLPNLHFNLGVALARLHDAAGAEKQFQQAIALGDKQPEVHFELANALRALGQTDQAKQQLVEYQAALKERDANTIAASKSAEADLVLQKGDTARAVQLYREAFAQAPKNAMLGYKLSVALDRANDTEGERTVLQQVVAIDPDFALAQNQLGYLESRRGDNAAAEEHFRQAVRAAPGFADAWISLAATLGMESKFPEAQQAAASALRLDPGNSQAQQLSHDLAAAQTQQPHN